MTPDLPAIPYGIFREKQQEPLARSRLGQSTNLEAASDVPAETVSVLGTIPFRQRDALQGGNA